MIDKHDRLKACRSGNWKPGKNLGPVCNKCFGRKTVWTAAPLNSVKQAVLCSMCNGVGRDAMPWAELMMGGQS